MKPARVLLLGLILILGCDYSQSRKIGTAQYRAASSVASIAPDAGEPSGCPPDMLHVDGDF
jgi:hypothetical protein